MNKSDFYYDLPERLIAQTPVYPRDSSKLLVYDRHNSKIEDKKFTDITDYLKKGDVLVVNKTRVIPARIFGRKESGARLEFLLHKRIDYITWETLAKPAKRAKIGDIFTFSEKLKCEIVGMGEEGVRIVRFVFDGVFEDVLSEIGTMPLPHYIHDKLDDPERYQTVYAKESGSSAAPTAGLHFTPELLGKIKGMGVEIAEVLLHVGLGTFRPVKTENILDHKMHSEYYSVSEECASIVNKAVKEGRRIVAVGTTSVRVLESVAFSDGTIEAKSGFTDIFIYPPYKFKTVSALITNFHLPESTLIMLISAFAGRENVLDFYKHAVENEYRFFSFGDACLIL